LERKPDVIRQTDAEAIRLAKTLIRSARYGALAVLDPETGHPMASRVGVATDGGGCPIVLISLLSAHTRALIADPRCSLLLGEPGKGDPLAHPRITLMCQAEKVQAGADDLERVSRRYLSRNPKAKLYAGLGDFFFFVLRVEKASLNGGFGKAYALTAQDLALDPSVVAGLNASEPGAIGHMNDDHRDAIALYAEYYAGDREPADWTMSGVDADGMDLIAGDRSHRIFFEDPLKDAADLHMLLVRMAREARAATQGG
jgi:putative heme iron utilization protein